MVIVTGNKSADLDSIVSAYVKALLESKKNRNMKECIALINIPKKELKLRPEVVFLFKRLYLDMEFIIFREDLHAANLKNRSANGSLEIIMTDHNIPEEPLKNYYRNIVEIIDHHKDSNYLKQIKKRTIIHTGSCSTLIGEQFLDFLENDEIKWDKKQKGLIANLLYSAIYVDIDHLTEKYGLDLNRDRRMLKYLKPLITLEDSFFPELVNIKFDTSSLTVDEHLIKDYKNWEYSNIPYGISSVLAGMEEMDKNNHNWVKALETFLKVQNIQILFVMHLIKEPRIRREMTVIFSDSFYFKNDYIDLLTRSDIFGIKQNYRKEDSPCYFFNQHKTEFSRKRIQPFIEELLKRLLEGKEL